MPSVRLPSISGGTNILSGNYFSGQGSSRPYSEVRLVAATINSGLVYVALSGGVTVGSGVFPLSGFTGAMDGFPLAPGGRYDVPKAAFRTSGSPAIFVQPDAACSGQAFVSWEVI